MNEQRKVIMLAAVVVLIIANFWVRQGGGGLDASFFDGGLDARQSAQVDRITADLDDTPRLDFSPPTTAAADEQGRNPFVFGVDRRAEEEARQERMAALQEARAAMEAAAAEREAATPPPPPKATFDGRLIGLMRDSNSGEGVVSIAYDSEIHILAVGDRLANRYELARIEPEKIIFRELTSNEEIELAIVLEPVRR